MALSPAIWKDAYRKARIRGRALKKKHDILTYAEVSAFEKGCDIDRSTPAGIRVRWHPVRNAAFKTAIGAAGAIVGFAFVLVAYNVFGWRPL